MHQLSILTLTGGMTLISQARSPTSSTTITTIMIGSQCTCGHRREWSPRSSPSLIRVWPSITLNWGCSTPQASPLRTISCSPTWSSTPPRGSQISTRKYWRSLYSCTLPSTTSMSDLTACRAARHRIVTLLTWLQDRRLRTRTRLNISRIR